MKEVKSTILKLVLSLVWAFISVELGKFQIAVVFLLSMIMFLVMDFVSMAEKASRR